MYICTCVCIHVRKESQGGVRQASGPWRVVLSLLTLISREYVKTCLEYHTIYYGLHQKLYVATCARYMYIHVQCTRILYVHVHVSTGEMVYVHVGDQKLKWMKHTSLYKCL